jgi:C4-dicarboxylate-specific signal transduction histidine kinase
MPDRIGEYISGRLSMAARLWLLSLIFLAPIALLTGLFITQSWKEISFAQKELRGNEYERQIWPLFRAAATGAAVSARDAARFDAARHAFDQTFGTTAGAAAFAQAAAPAERVEAGKNLLSLVADHSNLTLDPDLDSFYMIVAVAFRLPPMLQAMSELRNATVAPLADPARAVRIVESLQRLRNSAEAATSDLRTGMTEPGASATRDAILAHAAALERLCARVAAHRDALMAGAPGDSVAADMGALAVEVDSSWLAANAELETLLRERIARLTTALLFSLTVVVGSLALAAALAATIATGLARRTGVLVRTMDRLIAGDLATNVPYLGDSNESARIAQTIQAFKQSQIEGAQLREEAARQAAAAEEARGAAEAERARMLRFLSVGELASSIAHEINQPIAAIAAGGAAAARWLERAPPNLGRARAAVDRIVADASRAGDVIQRIRRMLSKGAAVLTEVDINVVAAEALQCIERERALARATVRTRLDPTLPTVRGDPVQLQQVIINLALNGVDAMRTLQDRPRVLTLATIVSAADEVQVSVEDSGVGFGPDGADHLFDPFYTTKQHGMGLGLSISRSIIDQHGGRIWAETAPDGGAVLCFTLQRWSSAKVAAAG